LGLEDRLTVVPPGGAGALSVTVPEIERPTPTPGELNAKAMLAEVTLTVVCPCGYPEAEAKMKVLPTAWGVAVNVTEELPAAMTTDPGTEIIAGLLSNVTVRLLPFAGTAGLTVTVTETGALTNKLSGLGVRVMLGSGTVIVTVWGAL
jgi:hypothetical protein